MINDDVFCWGTVFVINFDLSRTLLTEPDCPEASLEGDMCDVTGLLLECLVVTDWPIDNREGDGFTTDEAAYWDSCGVSICFLLECLVVRDKPVNIEECDNLTWSKDSNDVISVVVPMFPTGEAVLWDVCNVICLLLECLVVVDGPVNNGECDNLTWSEDSNAVVSVVVPLFTTDEDAFICSHNRTKWKKG